MKTLTVKCGFWQLGPILLVLSSCLGYKELPVEYDYSYSGNFKRYRTFELVTQVKVDSTPFNENIEKSIVSRMKFLGYGKSSRRPQLLVGYKIFNDSLRYRGYDQPDFDRFLVTQNRDLEYTPVKLDMNTAPWPSSSMIRNSTERYGRGMRLV
jgi:hypothetical protein